MDSHKEEAMDQITGVENKFKRTISGKLRPWEQTEFLSAGQRARNKYLCNKRWRENNPERHKAINAAHSRRYRELNPEKVHERWANWYVKNRENELVKKREYYYRNKERIKAQSKANYQKRQLHNKSPRCMSCESILKEPSTIYCQWCVTTYKLTTI